MSDTRGLGGGERRVVGKSRMEWRREGERFDRVVQEAKEEKAKRWKKGGIP